MVRRLRVPFKHDGENGHVAVSVEPSDDAAGVGKPTGTADFPTCTATIEYPAHGYRSFFGWVQLVRSDDNSSRGSGFDLDPFALFDDAPTPYAFYGFLPTLFDAPSRTHREPLLWLAHSFLAWSPLSQRQRRVIPLLGFSWGFRVDDAGLITPAEVRELEPDAWESHRPSLAKWFPAWQFDGWGSGAARQ